MKQSAVRFERKEKLPRANGAHGKQIDRRGYTMGGVRILIDVRERERE